MIRNINLDFAVASKFSFLRSVKVAKKRAKRVTKKRQNPKNYDGLECTGKLAKNLISSVFADIQKVVDAKPENVFAVFLSLLNDKMKPLVEPVFFSKGVLIVKVKNATLLSILSSQEKGRLVQNLGKLLPSAKIQNIVFQSS